MDINEIIENLASDIAPKHPDIGWEECFEKIKEGIQAGIKWQSEQGSSIECKIYWYDGPHLDYKWEQEQELITDDMEVGDEVIVQVRKKQ